MSSFDAQNEQASLATSIVNSALQQVSNYCTITCQNDISNTNITIIGGNATIDIGGTCSIVGSECAVKNIISSQIDNIINNMVQQSESNLGIFSLLGPSSNENTSISNAIKNQVSQIITNNCSVGADVQVANTNVFAQDVNNLKLSIGQSGTVSRATCALDTVAKLVLNNDVTNSVKQSESSCGGILWILIIVAIIVVLIICFPLLSAVFGAVGSVVKGTGTGVGKVVSLGGKKKQ